MAGPIESPNTLLSNTRLKFVDVVTEGPSVVFWPQSGVSGSNPMCSMLFDGVPLLNGDGSPNANISGQGFKLSYVSGTSGQAAMVGFEKVEALVPLPLNTRVTNPPLNAAFPNTNAGYPKTVVASFNTTMYPDAEGLKVTLRFPAVFTVDTTTNNTNGFDITWAIDISLNNGPFNTVDTRSLSDIAPSPKCTTPYLTTKVYPLPKTTPAQSFYEWKVRVRRVSQNVLSSNTQNDMYVDSMAVVSSNQYSYPMSAAVGIELSADQFAGIPTRAIDCKGINVLVPDGYTPTQYNINVVNKTVDIDSGDQNVDPVVNTLASVQDIFVGAAVEGPGIPAGTTVTFVDKVGPAFYFSISAAPTATNHGATVIITNPWVDQLFPASYPTIWTGEMTTRKWTDNPAWIFYDLVTNKRYGLGRYIRAEWVDKWTLYQIAQFCDEMVDAGLGDGSTEPRFTCNVALQQPQDAYTLLNNLVSVFRGMLYWANGRIFPVGSETRDPVFNFSNANVVNGMFSYSDTPRNTRSTVCVIKWTDPANQYRTTPERVEDTQGIARFGYVEKQITAFATTSRGQAVRAANWLLTVEQLLTETISFQTDAEGLYLRPGDVFNVYDNFRNNQQQGGRILDFSTGRDIIHLDRNVTLQNGFTYFMAAIVPATNLIATGSVTGSNQIGLIRNSQIETRKVISGPFVGSSYVALESGFSSGIYKSSVWTLSASGSSITVFDAATQYKCLSIGEPSPNTFDIVGVKYQTGINYLVNNNYSVIVSPPIEGDTTPPNAPASMLATPVTGLDIQNNFYSYLYLNWPPSTSVNEAYYTVSGTLAGTPFLIAQPTTTGVNFTPDTYGNYTFGVASNNANGYQSAFTTTTYNFANVNPFGTTAPLSGVFISANADPYYIRPQDARYTGYVGRNQSFGWHITLDSNDNETPTAQFITGYQVRFLKLGNESTILTSNDISISGSENASWNVDPAFLFTGTTVKPLRGFTFSVDTVDKFNNVKSGARLAVNNPQPPAPLNSGFLGYNGGITYNVTPRPQADTSGIFLWVNQNPAFTPTYDNVQFMSTNLAGSANIAPQTGVFYTWFSLVDSYGFSGSLAANGDYNAPIYGPISGNADAIFGTFFTDINSQLTGAFGYLTGSLTNLQTQITNTGSTSLATIIGLSGSITGAGAISTALNINLQTAVVSASGANSTQIAAVSARLVTSGAINYALAGTVMDALATTGGANSAYLTQLSAVTTGNGATVKMVMDAFATGSVNGLGGAAQARWGFEIGANGKIASMKATVNSYQSYGTAVFGNLDLQSDTFTAGSAGWRIKAGGEVEFNNGIFRGPVAVQSGTDSQVLLGSSPVFGNGVLAGKLGGAYGCIFLQTDPYNIIPARLAVFNSSSNSIVSLGIQASNNAGQLNLGNSAGTTTVTLDGSIGRGTFRSLYVTSGTNLGTIPQGYIGGVLDHANSVGQWGLFVGTSWQAAENRILTVASVDAANGNVLEQLVINGAGTATFSGAVNGLSFNTTSSRRFKDNVTTMSGSLSKVHSLRGVEFDWTRGTHSGKHDFGVIAEEVEQILPSAVTYEQDGTTVKAVDYGRLSAVLIEAVKELSQEVKELKESRRGI